MSQPDLFRLPRKPWNAGRMTGAKAPLKPKHIWAIRQQLTHSLRRTKVPLVCKKTGNVRTCQLLLGHRKLESIVRYLGIEVDDALEISE